MEWSKFKTWTADFRLSHEPSYLLGYPILNHTQMKPSKPVTKVCPDFSPISAARFAVEVALPQGENQRTQQFGVVACCRDPLRNRWAPGKPWETDGTGLHKHTRKDSCTYMEMERLRETHGITWYHIVSHSIT